MKKGIDMKILLLNPPSQKLVLRDQYCSFTSKANYYWPSIDLLVQSGILSQKYEVKVLDAVIEKMEEASCYEVIRRISPDCILFVTGITSYKGDFEFMKEVKARHPCHVIASGGFLLNTYRQYLREYSFLDAILTNFCSAAIGSYLEGDEDITDLAYRRDGEIIHRKGPGGPVSYPVPRHELFPIEKYRLPHGRRYPFSCVITNFGCPFHCKFCVAHDISYRERAVDEIMEELIYLNKLGIREVFFKDFTFGVNKKKLLHLCERMARETDLTWVCASRADVLNEEAILAMKRAGCHTIQFGIETANQKLLSNYKDKISIEQIEKILALCRRHKINTLGHFIIGLPGETKESVKETIKFSKRMKCDYASFNLATPLLGTELREKCIEEGYIDPEPEEYDLTAGKAAIQTELLSKEELSRLKNHAIRSFYFRPGYILQRIRGIHSFRNLLSLIREGTAIFTNYIKDISSR